jgi:hypothetical protein
MTGDEGRRGPRLDVEVVFPLHTKLGIGLSYHGNCDWCHCTARLREYGGVCGTCEAKGRTPGQKRRLLWFGFCRHVLMPLRCLWRWL